MKCTPEEAAAMAEKAGLRSWDNRKNITLDQRTARLIDLAREPLLQAIRQTLDENGHLADGENCTLIVLKRALREVGVPWKGDECAAEIRAGIEP